jgi:hypothetical protein
VQVSALPKGALVEWNLVATDGAVTSRELGGLAVLSRRSSSATTDTTATTTADVGSSGAKYTAAGSYDAAGSNGFVTAIFTAAPTDAAEVYAGVASPPPYPQQPRKELAEVPRGLFVVFLCSPPTLCA